MKALKGVPKEELANSLAMKRDYERELARLPTGKETTVLFCTMSHHPV